MNNPYGTKGLGAFRLALAIGLAVWGARAGEAAEAAGGTNRLDTSRAALEALEISFNIYSVGRKVADFPTNEDLSTPEAAYATVNRLSASGDLGFWKRLSAPAVASQLPAEQATRTPSPSDVTAALNTEIVEVRAHSNRYAGVLGRVTGNRKTIIDLRCFERGGDRWLNVGQSLHDNLDAARAKFRRNVAFGEAERILTSRPPVADPAKHLAPFIEFLRREGTDPEDYVLKAVTERTLVILGEVHNRPRYWALNTALVRSPEFRRTVGAIYLEFPINDQPLLDRFLASPTNDPGPVIEMLRDMFELGWPDQPTVEFCQAVWEANQNLPQEEWVRIVLVDMERPWSRIQKREDWRQYDVDRDAFMAQNILRDQQAHASDQRHALFIVGWMHALKNLTDAAGEPMKSASWHLRAALGETNVLAVFPHCPVMANRGAVSGRLGLGLFESAFAALGNRPLAFPLGRGPFGELPFDASMDFRTRDSYRAGFDAFLYLGPLENESMSPLVPGFYTDEYAREVDRRCRLMSGKGLEKVDGESLTRMRSPYWGQPRREWQALGPLNAWEYGSDWEKQIREAKHREAMADAAAIRQAAERLFAAIRSANYQHPENWQNFPAPDVDYTVHSDYPGWVRWVCQRFSTNPIVDVELEVIRLAFGVKQMPGVDYKLNLRNGEMLKGTLPFRWNVRKRTWEALEGLDWHRQNLGGGSQD